MGKNLRKIVLAITLAASAGAQAQMISTYAGSGVSGYSGDGSAATNATLYAPSDVKLDAAGNLYIADFYNNTVRKVDVTGIITTVAGTGFGAGAAGAGNYTGDGGQATAADLNGPYALAIDAAGYLYIADGYNHNVRRVSPAGIITNFAGTHTAAHTGDGGPATAASLNNPVGLAIDKAGNVYIADDHNHVVRKVTPAGIISTYVGNDSAGYSGDGGPASAAEINDPVGLAIDTSDNLYIADDFNNNIRKVTPAGIISTYVATDTTSGYSGDGGPATAAHLHLPRHICCDRAGNLYICDLDNNVVRMVAATGSHTITTIAGLGSVGYTGDGGAATGAEFNAVNGIAVDTMGRIFICDVGNDVIRMIGPWVSAVTDIHGNNAPGLVVTPNPTQNGLCSITLSSKTDEIVNITVTDITGKTIHTTSIQTNKPSQLQVDAPAGVYFITATIGKQQISKRIVVE